MENSFVSIRHLEKIYDKKAKAVYDFNLEIPRNEFVVLVGPSGCGKSTTLRMIAGLEDISSGELYIDGEYANYKPSKDRKIAIVFQNYALYGQMNVFQNIAFPLTVNTFSFPLVDKTINEAWGVIKVLTTIPAAELGEEIQKSKNANGLAPEIYLAKRYSIPHSSAHVIASLLPEEDYYEEMVEALVKEHQEKAAVRKEELAGDDIIVNEEGYYIDEAGNVITEKRKMTKYEIQEKVYAAADILNLGPYLDRLPKQLSGGQMQRVALGRAIVKNVPLFLMDEPLSNLDARLRLTMRSEIVKLHKNINATTIYVTHDQTEAMTMADRIVVMSKGFIQQIGAPDEIYNNPCNIFVAKFIGNPPTNVMEAEFNGKSLMVNSAYHIDISKSIAHKINNFYEEKLKEIEAVYKDYYKDEKNKNYILKILSILDENRTMVSEMKKGGPLKKLFRSLFGKNDKEDYEYESLTDIYNQMKEIAASENKKLTLAIRPENIIIVPYEGGEVSKNSYILEPDLVELLGSEYHVHFDFYGQKVIAKIGARTRINENTKMVLTINEQDFMLFDKITGERIY